MGHAAAAHNDPLALSEFAALLFAAAGLVCGVVLAFQSPEIAMKLQGAILAAGCVIFFLLVAVLGRGRYGEWAIKGALILSLWWGAAGLQIGDYLAWQLAYPVLNLDQPWLNFGRLRPLHTSMMMFGFIGNALLAASFYAAQRGCLPRAHGLFAMQFVVIGYNAMIFMTISGYVLGVSQGREFAEPEWAANLWFALVWLVCLLAFAGAIRRGAGPRIHVANWFYLVFILATALLHVVSNIAIPVSFLGSKSYVLYSGVQDALIQWLHAHGAVGLSITAGLLGMAYYFLPARAGRPVYSEDAARAHCVALCLAFVWIAPHSLHFAAYPDWAQTFVQVLVAAVQLGCLAGLIGLLFLSGGWEKVGKDPVMRFFILALALKATDTALNYRAAAAASASASVSAPDAMHSIELGWAAMTVFGAAYCLIPWLWKRKGLFSNAMVAAHFWIWTAGGALYIGSTWSGATMQGLMFNSYDQSGFLQYSFVETVEAMHPYYVARAVGGLLLLIGVLIMLGNLLLTVVGQPAEAEDEDLARDAHPATA